MAKLLLLHHLLLLLSSFTLISAAPATTAATTPPFLPFQPSIQTEQQLQNIIEALIGASDFGNWAGVLSVSDPSTFPITATLFIPSDDNSISNPSLFNPSTILYHIVPQQLSFSNLQQFQINSRLPTLLPGKTILVTNNSRLNYTIDGSLVIRPDLYINGEIAVHGITSVLNYSTYGGGVFLDPFLPIPIPTSSSSSSSSPGSSTGNVPQQSSSSDFANVGNSNTHHNDAACSCIEFPVLLSVFLAIFGFKINGFYPIR